MFFQDPFDPCPGGPSVSSQPVPAVMPEEYLAADRLAEIRSEYFAGRIFPMAGTSRRHNLIVVNLIVTIRPQLKGRECEMYPGHMRLKVAATGLYTYPDVTVVCGAPQLEDAHLDTLLNPTALIEVLSPSPVGYDRGRKAEHYRRIDSLREYLFVAQHEPRIERHRRMSEREWMLTEARAPDESIELESIGCVLSLHEVYDGVL
jgi:Uma2 family endonuclease